jgi:hypothetical protein
VIGFITYIWMVDFPENSHKSFHFLTAEEQAFAEIRISDDRGDVKAEEFSYQKCLVQFADPKLYGFCVLFFCQNVISTGLSYFLPIILQSGMGFSSDQSILLSAPPYFYAVIPAIVSSVLGDRYQLRGLVITFNCICTIVGFSMLGKSQLLGVLFHLLRLVHGLYYTIFNSSWNILQSHFLGALLHMSCEWFVVWLVLGTTTHKTLSQLPVVSSKYNANPTFWSLGFTTTNAVRYIGTYLATGAYVSNWAAMNAYQANNIVGQWKRATFAASITACNGLGGIAGSFIFRQNEAPR